MSSLLSGPPQSFHVPGMTSQGLAPLPAFHNSWKTPTVVWVLACDLCQSAGPGDADLVRMAGPIPTCGPVGASLCPPRSTGHGWLTLGVVGASLSSSERALLLGELTTLPRAPPARGGRIPG